MEAKTLQVLEYDKVLERLAAHCDFSASQELARYLKPADNHDLALLRLAQTSEARRLLSSQDLTIGGAHDIRPLVKNAALGGRLQAGELLTVRNTLVACRDLRRSLEKQAQVYPRLHELSQGLPLPPGLVEAISRTVSDEGEVLDSASPQLGTIRREMHVAHERLMSRLNKYLTDAHTAPMLQDGLITQRDGRYVIPLRVEFKGQVQAIVHDQSSSGATLFVEPLPVVELNNQFRQAQLAERDEVDRVLLEVSQKVGEEAESIINGIAALAELDLALARAKYADQIQAAEPILHPPLESGDGQPASLNQRPRLRLVQARHPLLDPASVVPIDVDLAPGVFAVVITGPNTGGKTVSLKTVGLLVLMAQSGLHIPASSGSELTFFNSIWADIGDEQSIEQSLSTFSGHITNIVHLLKKADAHSLVIIDELGAGTDPQEGAALAMAILGHLLAAGVTTLVATHYPELKTFAHSTPGVVNASLEFDLGSLRPTFHLTIGLPGRSNALAIAERLGLPADILAAARSGIDPADLRSDDLLDALHKERRLARKERLKAEKARVDSHKLRRQLSERLEQIDQERLAVIEKARAEGELEVIVLLEQLKNLRRELKQAHQPLEVVNDIEEKVELLQEQLTKPLKPRAAPRRVPKGALKVGDKVLLKTIDKEGVITSLGVEDLEVQVGSLHMRLRLDEVRRRAPDEQPAEEKITTVEQVGGKPHSVGLAASPGLELDLRGQRAEEALALLEDYLDKAFLAGMPFVRIIHGKGTGKLRSEVRRTLKNHPQVLSFEEGQQNEGGEGVTVVKITG